MTDETQVVETVPVVETTPVADTPQITIVVETPRFKRHYLRNGKTAPEGATVFTTEKSGKQYYLKEIGKTKGYK